MNSNMANLNPILVGVIAALVFCAMVLVFRSIDILVLVPLIFGTLPIYVAALGWGSRSGIVAVLIVTAISTYFISLENGILIGLMLAPAALAGYQINLAQNINAESDELVWYPFGRVLFWITLFVACTVILFGVLMDFNPDMLATQLAPQFEQFMKSMEGNSGFSEEDRRRALMINIQMLPFVFPSFCVAVQFFNLLLGLRIARRLNVLARPHEDIATVIGLPQIALGTLVISLIGMILAGPPISFLFSALAGAQVMAFSIVGLAMFHKHIRTWPTRPILLWLTYTIILFMLFPVYLFSFAGIFRVAGRINTNPEQQDQ